MAKELDVRGLINIQYAVKNNVVYVLEVNPRASRTIPFISKAVGVPLANLATTIMLGETLEELGFTEEKQISHYAVKESVFPFIRFPGVDAVLGPEMKSTGEVMGIDSTFGVAYAKSQVAAGQELPTSGTVFISVRDSDKRDIVFVAKKLVDLGFSIISTSGTAEVLQTNGIDAVAIPKLYEGRRNIIDYIKDGQVGLIINTPGGKATKEDEQKIRSHAVLYGVPLITTIAGAQASVHGIESLIKHGKLQVTALQEYHRRIA